MIFSINVRIQKMKKSKRKAKIDNGIFVIILAFFTKIFLYLYLFYNQAAPTITSKMNNTKISAYPPPNLRYPPSYE